MTSLAITFDDGQLDNHQNALPVLDRQILQRHARRENARVVEQQVDAAERRRCRREQRRAGRQQLADGNAATPGPLPRRDGDLHAE